ncbi:ABC transporter permease [Streptacidiphilus sp. PB12-B1b]|uniref:ABC transporter permease n=1 Tax=Streptacidiphilus sp. PB12-B1b TaxID=2705012 RepID=UPI0015F995E7|nr:ABC transporter permease [Streptacidiphilus sp. PB12-B1b]QMU77541.1 ABC transporter permease [Streptacidiphilus sp. PB12-B1b]
MKYFLQRLAFYLFTAWAAITLNFFVPRLIPGDPVSALISRSQGQISTQAVKSLYVLFGLNKHESLISQYGDYWSQLAHGDLGISFSNFPTPVTTILEQSLPWTIALAGFATVISFTTGTLLGVLAGWRRGSRLDFLLPVTTFVSSIPAFWLGILAIAVVLAVGWSIPVSQGYDPGIVPGWNAQFIGNAVDHSWLPLAMLVITSMSGWILSMRNMMVTVGSEDYITVAHAKGLSERRVMFGYAARNALLPNVSGLSLALGQVIGSTILVEIVFSYPGVGYEMLQAVGGTDYPLMEGIFLVITLAVLLANLLADIAYLILDPRTRKEG